eukprot:g4693.t1
MAAASLKKVDNDYHSFYKTLCSNNPNDVQFRSRVGLGRIGIAGAFIGFTCGVHLCLFLFAASSFEEEGRSSLLRWSIYAIGLCIFHFMEFVTTARWNPQTCTFDSYLLDHSFAYTVAAISSWVEFWLERFLIGSWCKDILFPDFTFYIFVIGIILLVGGQTIRTVSMWQCGSNFAHIIVTEKDSEHKLVHDGLYSVFRHPSYFGWFWWSVGTQIVLGNPICVVAYFAASWRFFNHRIYYEERLLSEVQFPGNKEGSYKKYCETRWIGIPFIQGYINQTKIE